MRLQSECHPHHLPRSTSTNSSHHHYQLPPLSNSSSSTVVPPPPYPRQFYNPYYPPNFYPNSNSTYSPNSRPHPPPSYPNRPVSYPSISTFYGRPPEDYYPQTSKRSVDHSTAVNFSNYPPTQVQSQPQNFKVPRMCERSTPVHTQASIKIENESNSNRGTPNSVASEPKMPIFESKTPVETPTLAPLQNTTVSQLMQLHQQHYQQTVRNETIFKPVPLAPSGANPATNLPPPNLAFPPGVNPMDSNITLWQFLLELLQTGEHTNLIQWTNNEGEFKLLDAEGVARLWGNRKGKMHMNYDKLSRALRYYYDKNIIKKVIGQKFVYKFCTKPEDANNEVLMYAMNRQQQIGFQENMNDFSNIFRQNSTTSASAATSSDSHQPLSVANNTSTPSPVNSSCSPGSVGSSSGVSSAGTAISEGHFASHAHGTSANSSAVMTSPSTSATSKGRPPSHGSRPPSNHSTLEQKNMNMQNSRKRKSHMISEGPDGTPGQTPCHPTPMSHPGSAFTFPIPCSSASSAQEEVKTPAGTVGSNRNSSTSSQPGSGSLSRRANKPQPLDLTNINVSDPVANLSAQLAQAQASSPYLQQPSPFMQNYLNAFNLLAATQSPQLGIVSPMAQCMMNNLFNNALNSPLTAPTTASIIQSLTSTLTPSLTTPMPPPRTPQNMPHSQPSTFFQFPPPAAAQALATAQAITNLTQLLSPHLTSPHFFSPQRNLAANLTSNMSFSGKLNRSPDSLKTPIPHIENA